MPFSDFSKKPFRVVFASLDPNNSNSILSGLSNAALITTNGPSEFFEFK